jgi:hypothetical protein
VNLSSKGIFLSSSSSKLWGPKGRDLVVGVVLVLAIAPFTKPSFEGYFLSIYVPNKVDVTMNKLAKVSEC